MAVLRQFFKPGLYNCQIVFLKVWAYDLTLTLRMIIRFVINFSLFVKSDVLIICLDLELVLLSLNRSHLKLPYNGKEQPQKLWNMAYHPPAPPPSQLCLRQGTPYQKWSTCFIFWFRGDAETEINSHLGKSSKSCCLYWFQFLHCVLSNESSCLIRSGKITLFGEGEWCQTRNQFPSWKVLQKFSFTLQLPHPSILPPRVDVFQYIENIIVEFDWILKRTET